MKDKVWSEGLTEGRPNLSMAVARLAEPCRGVAELQWAWLSFKGHGRTILHEPNHGGRGMKIPRYNTCAILYAGERWPRLIAWKVMAEVCLARMRVNEGVLSLCSREVITWCHALLSLRL